MNRSWHPEEKSWCDELSGFRYLGTNGNLPNGGFNTLFIIEATNLYTSGPRETEIRALPAPRLHTPHSPNCHPSSSQPTNRITTFLYHIRPIPKAVSSTQFQNNPLDKLID